MSSIMGIECMNVWFIGSMLDECLVNVNGLLVKVIPLFLVGLSLIPLFPTMKHRYYLKG